MFTLEKYAIEFINMKIEVSNGEILDKYSILDIKLNRIEDKNKLDNIQNEYDSLTDHVHDIFNLCEDGITSLYNDLLAINKELWDIEDTCRDLERKKEFGEVFIKTVRSVYLTNDKRSEVKKKINILTGSDLIEEKGYTDYS